MKKVKDFLCPQCNKLLARYELEWGTGYLLFWCRRCHKERSFDLEKMTINQV